MSFDTDQTRSSNCNIKDQKEEVESFEIMIIGFNNSSSNRLFQNLCGLKEFPDFSVFPKKGIKSNVYFHLTPNIRDINHLKTTIDFCIYGSF